MQDPLSQQLETSPAVHRALDQFELVDLPLDLPLTVGQF